MNNWEVLGDREGGQLLKPLFTAAYKVWTLDSEVGLL